MENPFQVLAAIDDTDLASKGVIRISPTVFVRASAIASWDARPEGVLFITLLNAREAQQIPHSEAQRVLGLLMKSLETPPIEVPVPVPPTAEATPVEVIPSRKAKPGEVKATTAVEA